MKKTNTFLLALVAVLCCLFAVACDKDPTPPRREDVEGFSPIDPSKESDLRVCRQAFEFIDFCGMDEEVLDTNDTSKLFWPRPVGSYYKTDEEWNEYIDSVLLALAFAKEGKADSFDDDLYIEVDGNKYYEDSGDENDIVEGVYEIKDLKVESFSSSRDESSKTKTVGLKNLSFSVEISSPVVYRIDVKFSAKLVVGIYYDEEDSEWYTDEESSYTLDFSFDDVERPTFRYDSEKNRIIYGDYVRNLLYTVTFDSKGGTPVPSQKVEHGYEAIEPEAPTKEGTAGFIEWRTKDGESFDFSDGIFEDTTLYAAYYLPATEEMEGRIYSMFPLVGIFNDIRDGGIQDLENMFENPDNTDEYLFEIMLLVLGETDSFGSVPYYEIAGQKYYSYKDNKDVGLEAGMDYTIEGTVGLYGGGHSFDGKGNSSDWRGFNDLCYTVSIMDDSGAVLYEIPVRISGRVEVETHEDETHIIMVNVSILDENLQTIEDRTFKLDSSSNEGYYCDYIFDSSKYPR